MRLIHATLFVSRFSARVDPRVARTSCVEACAADDDTPLGSTELDPQVLAEVRQWQLEYIAQKAEEWRPEHLVPLGGKSDEEVQQWRDANQAAVDEWAREWRESKRLREMPSPLEGRNVSVDELRALRASEREEEEARLRAAFKRAGMTTAGAKRLLGRHKSVQKLSAGTLAARVEALNDALPPAAVKRVVSGAPLVLLHDLPTTLPTKLEAVSGVMGGDVGSAVAAAPALLLVDHTRLAARREQLQQLLGGVNVSSVLRRAPRLLGRSEESLRASLAALGALGLPAHVDAKALAVAQPTLLGYDANKTLAPKLRRLRALCTEGEWAQLMAYGPSTIARVLACSAEVLERLAVVPREPAGERKVATLLTMPRRKFEQEFEPRGGDGGDAAKIEIR